MVSVWGLLGSGFALATPVWLRSVDFKSGFSKPGNDCAGESLRPRAQSIASTVIKSKVFLLVLLVGSTILAGVVGPASALLFIPTQLWMKASSTHFYLKGKESDLWPSTLTQNHTGPMQCSSSPLHLDYTSYLHASWRVLLGGLTVLNPIRPEFFFYIPGGSALNVPPASMVYDNVAILESNCTHGDPDTWAVAPHLGVSSHSAYLTQYTFEAFSPATGWKRRLRDFVEGRAAFATGSKLAFTRTVCGPRAAVAGATTKTSIPLVDENRFWRAHTLHGTDPIINLNFEDLNVTDWNGLQPNGKSAIQYRAKWLPLPSNIDSGSALVIKTLQDAQSGYEEFDALDSPPEWRFKRASMLDPRYTPYYSRSIKIEQSWLDALAPPMPEQSNPGNDLVMTSFEALLNQSGLITATRQDIAYGKTMLDLHTDHDHHHRYITTLYFLNALSRVGLPLHLEDHPNSVHLRWEFDAGPIKNDSFIGEVELYPERNSTALYTRAYYQQYRFGTAWALVDAGQYISMVLLGIHVVFALAHSVILCWTHRSNTAWESVNELIVLAYNSATRPKVFENCSIGIKNARTLDTKVRIGTRALEDGSVQAELVVCDEGEAGDVVLGKAYS
ncbi:hypothetical protein EK21DRAFT_84879 [Setomelanomma holmii]|uniref:Uncharacterized protein n=1 Tax=Setomelanomma holmii TaxID=210430 RepID=A0A9P4HHR8_9PLEO|nr:hypothetical protein EK21DRAFT_84879 [Setomelanomma holmii]